MSLISDALKKAQRVRSGDGTGAGAQSLGGRRGRLPMGLSPGALAGIVVGLVAAAIAITVYFVRTDPKEIAAQVALATEKARSAPPAQNTATPNMPPPVVAPAAAAKPPDPQPAGTRANPVPAIAAGPAPAANVPPPATPPAPISYTGTGAVASGKPDPRIEAFVDAISIKLIRKGDPGTGTEPRIMLSNDKVFRINEYLDRALGVRLTGVDTEGLSFTDDRGVVYLKRF